LNTLFESIHSSDLTLICTLNAPEIQPLKSILADQKEQEIKTVCALIGPEGDFTEEEVHLAIQHGAFPALLGEHVLRAETAACYILSILSYALE
jgi:RsmE family RNA methyltransferase